MNLVISMPKTGKAYAKKLDQPEFLYKKIGEEIDLGVIGLEGYKAKITGGSDKEGFPMKSTLPGTIRKKLLLSKGVGFRAGKKDEKKRISIRGGTVDEKINQLNLVVTVVGSANLDEMLAKKTEESENVEKIAKEAKEKKKK